MNYKQAQELIFSLTGHVSEILFLHVCEDGTINGQLTTGNPLAPIVAINSNNVCESDVIEAIETEEITESAVDSVILDVNVWGSTTPIAA